MPSWCAGAARWKAPRRTTPPRATPAPMRRSPRSTPPSPPGKPLGPDAAGAVRAARIDRLVALRDRGRMTGGDRRGGERSNRPAGLCARGARRRPAEPPPPRTGRRRIPRRARSRPGRAEPLARPVLRAVGTAKLGRSPAPSPTGWNATPPPSAPCAAPNRRPPNGTASRPSPPASCGACGATTSPARKRSPARSPPPRR